MSFHVAVSLFDRLLVAMQVCFLGTGTSQGVPMIAQPEGMLDMQNPKNWRTRTSVHVKMGNTHIQVDCSPEFRLQCLWNNIKQVDLVLLTHSHSDHIVGMDDLRRFCDLNEYAALPVYGQDFDLNRVKTIYPYAILDKPVVKGYPAFQLQEMPQKLELEDGTIESVALPHGGFTTLGFHFTEHKTGKRFAYYTDCSLLTDEAKALANGCDLLVLDALRQQKHRSHMTIDEAVEAAQLIGAPESYFVHMACYVDHERDQKSLPKNISFAWDGLVVDL